MNKRNNLIRMKVDFEHNPIMDKTKRVATEDDFDDMIGELKLKLFGK